MRLMVIAVCLLGAGIARAEEAAAPAPVEKTYPVRTWTSVNGNILEGAFVKEEDGKVYIRRANGRIAATSRAKLSPNDLAWIATATQTTAEKPVRSFEKATQKEIMEMEVYKRIRRISLKTYSKLTNNNREDKTLAFLLRDANKIYGWSDILADCYITDTGKRGKLKEMNFITVNAVPLGEAARMAVEKFQLGIAYPILVSREVINGQGYWILQNVPDYLSAVKLKEADESTAEKPLIDRFDIFFPPPAP